MNGISMMTRDPSLEIYAQFQESAIFTDPPKKIAVLKKIIFCLNGFNLLFLLKVNENA